MDNALLQRFETGVDRRGTGCEKWDDCLSVFGRADILPMWVADMDFQAPQPVVDALAARAINGVFGYAIDDPDGNLALINWMKTRHDLNVDESWIRYSPGVVSSMLFALKAVCDPGDRVAVMTPVYGPFYRMVEQSGLVIYRCPLIERDCGYAMDLDRLEEGFKAGVKALMISSPHNPVGRIWTMGELKSIVDLCNRYGAALVSDEIHMDFELPGNRHTPILNVPGADQAILLASATKTFNLAGLRHSSIIAKDEAVRAKLDKVLLDCAVGGPNLFGALAQKTAYQQGGPWLDGLIEYIDGSRRYVEDFLRDRLPEVKCSELQGTYLMWLDFRALGLDADGLKRLLVHEAGVGLNGGTYFGPEGAGFARLNLAAPRKRVAECMDRIERAVRAR